MVVINSGFSREVSWSIQTELERDRDRELNLYQWVLRYLPPAMKLWQGNVFTNVCQEFCPQGAGMHGGGEGGMCGRGHPW